MLAGLVAPGATHGRGQCIRTAPAPACGAMHPRSLARVAGGRFPRSLVRPDPPGPDLTDASRGAPPRAPLASGGVAGDDLAYTVRRSARARRVRVRVEPDGGVIVTLPQRSREREAAAAVRELRPWIDRRRAEVEVARGAIERAPGGVPLLGELLTLREEPGRTRAHRRGGVLLVPVGDGAAQAIERWYRRTARAELGPRVSAATEALGAEYSRITIRDQRTRWGSCSPTGASRRRSRSRPTASCPGRRRRASSRRATAWRPACARR